MLRTLQRYGNSVALVIDEMMLEALHITADSPVQITFSGGSMIVTPTHTGIPQEELEEDISQLRPCYKKAMENLAK